LNFDNFKSHETKVKPKDAAPAWPDSLTFTYTTKYADCLSRKMLWLEVYDYNRFSANEFLGVARVDLFTCATGPVKHTMSLRDGRKTRGTIAFAVRMEQVATVEARFTGVQVPRPPAAASHAAARVQLSIVPPATLSPATAAVSKRGGGASASSLGSVKGDVGAWTLPNPDAVFAEGTLGDMLSSRIRVEVLGDGGVVLAASDVPVSGFHSYVADKPVPWTLSLPGDVKVTGNVAYTGFPSFVQMTGGSHSDGGITGAAFPVPDVPNKPLCNVDAVVVPSGEGEGAKATKPRLARLPSGKVVYQLATDVAEGTPVRDPAADLPPVPLAQPLYVSGVNTAPPLGARLFAATPGLPVCWIRRLDPRTPDRVAFENLATGMVETDLPTESEFVTVIPPGGDGPLGIAFEPNFSGVARHGWRSGRRNSGFDVGAVVRTVRPGSLAEVHAPRLRPGHHLIAVNGMSTTRLPFDSTISLLKAAGRPLVLRFHDPYAVPADVAISVGNPTTPVPGTYSYALTAAAVVGGATVASAPTTPLSSIAATVVSQQQAKAGAAGASLPGLMLGAGPLPKRMIAQAQQTLDLALDVLSKVDMHAPLLAAKDNPANADAAAQAAAVHRALSDPGFLRSINAVITGASKDVLPAPLQQSLAAAEATEGKGDDEGDEPKVTPTTEDRAANRALKVIAALTATDDAALAAAAPVAYMDGVRQTLKQRVHRMADMGMFRRAMDTIGNRGDPAFAAGSVKTVSTVMRVYGLNPGELGMESSSLVELQGNMRKDQFEPMMADATTLVKALASDNPDQDGVAFVQACIRAAASLDAMTQAGWQRAASAPGGPLVYVHASGAPAAAASPDPVTAAMRDLCDVDRRARLLDDAAVTVGPEALFAALRGGIAAQGHDAYVAAVLLAAVGKLTAHPTNASHAVAARLLDSAALVLSRHDGDARAAEGAAAFYFNVGRDLDCSEELLVAGAVARGCSLASRWMAHRTNAGGTPAQWPPAGREEEIAEGVTFRGSERWARDRNAVRPRLVRSCINVLINLACYRTPIPDGSTSVSLIARHRGVELLGDVLRLHLAEAPVVTSVLNCAANIAFKNMDLQLALGERVMDAVVLAGIQFRSDTTLLSMALRTIGNLTNQDANIYRSLGMGAARMISAAMRENAVNVPLQNLAASVLSNIASVEPVDEETAKEYAGLMAAARKARLESAYLQLRPSPADEAATGAVLSSARSVWCQADWLLLEEDAVGALVASMTFHSTDVSVVETCLRTLMCIGSDEVTARAMVDRFDLINKTLFVMRACDFDVGVQLAGASVLQTLASSPSTTAAVASSDAAHMLAFAINTHRTTLLTGLTSAAAAIAALPAEAGLDGQLNALGAAMEGKPLLALQLMARAFEALQMLASPRAAKAILELQTHLTALPLAQAALNVLHTLARRGFNVDLPPSCDPVLQLLLTFVHATCIAVSLWAQGPQVGADAGTEDLLALRHAIVSSERTYYALARIVETCAIGSGQAGDPSRPAVQLKAGRAVVDVLASCLIAHHATCLLPGRATAERAPAPGVRMAGAFDSIVLFLRAGGLRAIGALMLAYTADTMRLASVSLLPDVAQLTARLLTAQLLVLLDLLASYTLPTVSFSTGVMPDEASLAADPIAIAAGMAAAVTNAFAAVMAQPGLSSVDIAPPPMRFMDLADLATRISAHLASHLQMPEPIGVGGAVVETEAAAIFCFSISRARQQLMAAAHQVGRVATAVPSAPAAATPPAPPGGGGGGGGTLRTHTMAPGAMHAAASSAAQHDAAAARAAAATGSGSGGGRRALSRMASVRGMLGDLASEGGVAGVAWADSKTTNVILRVTPDGATLNVFGIPSKRDKEAVLLAALSPADFTAIRTGSIMVGGKLKKQGGLFKSAPKVDRSLCFDRGADTILQVELPTAALAERVRVWIDTFASAGGGGAGGGAGGGSA